MRESIINNIIKAKNKGYFIELHYIGVDSADIAKQRIAGRIRQGGHGIAEQDIERRYIETFDNLIYKSGKLVRISYNVPNWYEKFAANMGVCGFVCMPYCISEENVLYYV